jgi:hypothetical protein
MVPRSSLPEDHDRATGLRVGRHEIPRWILDALVALAGIYLIHYLFCRFLLSELVPPSLLQQPLGIFPAHIFVHAWDSAYYKDLFNSYDRYFFPPLYPICLRLVATVCWFRENAFEKSAVVLNLLSHATIVLGVTYYLRQDRGLQAVRAWVVLALIFFYPGHNVFFAAYSDSLFLAVTVVALILHKEKQTGWASLIAGVSSLVRYMGTFLVLAFIAEEMIKCLRERRFSLRRLSLAAIGLIVIMGWHLYLWHLGTSTNKELQPWLADIAAAPNPHSSLLRYLAYAGRWSEVLPFWLSVAAIIYCAMRKLYAEMFYLLMFYCSLGYLFYRPYSWSRYVSIFFPMQIMVADWLKGRPRLAMAVVAICIVFSYRLQSDLFQARIGEP